MASKAIPLISQTKQALKGCTGYILSILLPKKTNEIKKNHFTIQYQSLSTCDQWIIEGIKWHALITKKTQFISDIHKTFWQNESAVEFHQRNQHRFETISLRYFQDIVLFCKDYVTKNEAVFSSIVEIGTGSGQFLQHLSVQIPSIKKLIGIDLSKAQTEQNQARYQDTSLTFIDGDAFQWIHQQSIRNTIFFTHNGVLEYFSEKNLLALFSFIAQNKTPALFAIIEPVAENFDFNQTFESQPFSSDFSFSHNYPHLFKTAGWHLVFQKEVWIENRSRILLLVAEVK
jgi:SAM-dependent methyltransferase